VTAHSLLSGDVPANQPWRRVSERPGQSPRQFAAAPHPILVTGLRNLVASAPAPAPGRIHLAVLQWPEFPVDASDVRSFGYSRPPFPRCGIGLSPIAAGDIAR